MYIPRYFVSFINKAANLKINNQFKYNLNYYNYLSLNILFTPLVRLHYTLLWFYQFTNAQAQKI